MSGVDSCWTPSVQKLRCRCQDCLSSISTDTVPNAACAVKLGLSYCVQQFEKYLVNLLTSLPKLNFCRFLTDVRIVLPLRHEPHVCLQRSLYAHSYLNQRPLLLYSWCLTGVFLVPSPVCWQHSAIFVFPWAAQFFTWSFWPLNLLALLVIGICGSGLMVSSRCVWCRAKRWWLGVKASVYLVLKQQMRWMPINLTCLGMCSRLWVCVVH